MPRLPSSIRSPRSRMVSDPHRIARIIPWRCNLMSLSTLNLCFIPFCLQRMVDTLRPVLQPLHHQRPPASPSTPPSVSAWHSVFRAYLAPCHSVHSAGCLMAQFLCLLRALCLEYPNFVCQAYHPAHLSWFFFSQIRISSSRHLLPLLHVTH